MGSAFPTLPFAHSFTGSYDAHAEFLPHSAVVVPGTTLGSEDVKMKKVTKTRFCSQGVLVGGHTSKWGDTIAKGGVRADSEHCAVPSTASPLAP